jgi:hypothetical protein
MTGFDVVDAEVFEPDAAEADGDVRPVEGDVEAEPATHGVDLGKQFVAARGGQQERGDLVSAGVVAAGEFE